MSLKRRLNILSNSSGESAVLTVEEVSVEGAEKLDDVSCLNEPANSCFPSTSSLGNESGGIPLLPCKCITVTGDCSLPTSSSCSEIMSSSGTVNEAAQLSLRDCLENEQHHSYEKDSIQHFEITAEVIVNALASSLPSTPSCSKRRLSASRGSSERTKIRKSPRKPSHSRNVCEYFANHSTEPRSDLLSGSQVIEEGRTYGIDPEKNYFRVKNQLKEVKPYCFVCRKKASRSDSIHPPKNASILESWLQSLSGGDPLFLAHLEDRLKMAIVDNVLCSDHYDTSKTPFYLLGTKLPVANFTRDVSKR